MDPHFNLSADVHTHLNILTCKRHESNMFHSCVCRHYSAGVQLWFTDTLWIKDSSNTEWEEHIFRQTTAIGAMRWYSHLWFSTLGAHSSVHSRNLKLALIDFMATWGQWKQAVNMTTSPFKFMWLTCWQKDAYLHILQIQHNINIHMESCLCLADEQKSHIHSFFFALVWSPSAPERKYLAL